MARRASAPIAIVAFLAMVVVASPAGAVPVPAIPIPQDPREAGSVPAFVGHAAVPDPFPGPLVPSHPFMAPNGRNNIHDDAYMTDTYPTVGPLGPNIAVTSSFFAADCASL